MSCFLKSLHSSSKGFLLATRCEQMFYRMNNKDFRKPKKRLDLWLPKKTRVLSNERITSENKEFLQEVVKESYLPPALGLVPGVSPLKSEPIEPQVDFVPKAKRPGLIVKKIGIYPMWLKNGRKILTTLLQVADNHVIKYIPPEEYQPGHRSKKFRFPKVRNGCLVVGAENCDPQLVTKEYHGIFKNSGVMPKKLLGRFHISPEAALQPGTPLYAAHFKPGEFVDISGKTVDRGFQGVMKRWGFHGMPATHGQTKTHRRGGNIGSGGQKARVMPGTKMPGHMGNRIRILRGVRILRVNTKFNVIWVQSPNLPGETNNLLYMYDTVLPLKLLKPEGKPYFPTYLPDIAEEPLEEEYAVEDLHLFDSPSLAFEEDTKKK